MSLGNSPSRRGLFCDAATRLIELAKRAIPSSHGVSRGLETLKERAPAGRQIRAAAKFLRIPDPEWDADTESKGSAGMRVCAGGVMHKCAEHFHLLEGIGCADAGMPAVIAEQTIVFEKPLRSINFTGWRKTA